MIYFKYLSYDVFMFNWYVLNNLIHLYNIWTMLHLFEFEWSIFFFSIYNKRI